MNLSEAPFSSPNPSNLGEKQMAAEEYLSVCLSIAFSDGLAGLSYDAVLCLQTLPGMWIISFKEVLVTGLGHPVKQVNSKEWKCWSYF